MDIPRWAYKMDDYKGQCSDEDEFPEFPDVNAFVSRELGMRVSGGQFIELEAYIPSVALEQYLLLS
jgi:hypothetical protein